jgi:hypothetical protein
MCPSGYHRLRTHVRRTPPLRVGAHEPRLDRGGACFWTGSFRVGFRSSRNHTSLPPDSGRQPRLSARMSTSSTATAASSAGRTAPPIIPGVTRASTSATAPGPSCTNSTLSRLPSAPSRLPGSSDRAASCLDRPPRRQVIGYHDGHVAPPDRPLDHNRRCSRDSCPSGGTGHGFLRSRRRSLSRARRCLPSWTPVALRGRSSEHATRWRSALAAGGYDSRVDPRPIRVVGAATTGANGMVKGGRPSSSPDSTT